MDKKYTIVITRQFGCGGRTIGRRLAEAFQIKYYDTDIFENDAELNLPDEVQKKIDSMLKVEKLKPMERLFTPSSWIAEDEAENDFESRSIIMHYLANKESMVFVGGCADYVLDDVENVIRIYLKAPFEYRLEKCMAKTGLSREYAMRYVAEKEENRRRNQKRFAGYKPGNINHQEFVLDVSLLDTEGIIKLLETFLKSVL